MGSYRRAALAGVQEGGQVVEVDLPPVPRQDSACSTHTFEHGTGQRRVGFLASGQGALSAHLSVDICQDESSDISCVCSRRSSPQSSLTTYRTRKLKPLPLSHCLPNVRGTCWRIVLRSCRMGERCSEELWEVVCIYLPLGLYLDRCLKRTSTLCFSQLKSIQIVILSMKC